ncbi:hypothetical protein SLVCU150_0663 [Staphylococcus lugdunensis VCU150]|nr:hypothetical protein SLVCU150_0663 [Staphylococcus lugdunensis VCU150]
MNSSRRKSGNFVNIIIYTSYGLEFNLKCERYFAILKLT